MASRTASFDIKVPDPHSIKIQDGMTYENVISQLQAFSPHILCLVDGKTLECWDSEHAARINLRFDHKQRRGDVADYYFRDIATQKQYCVFGREYAQKLFPRLNDVDPVPHVQPRTLSQTITITHGRIIHSHISPNYDNIVCTKA